MVAAVKNVEHDRSRAKIKWHILPDLCSPVAFYLQLLQPSPLDLRHSDDFALQPKLDALGVRPYSAFRHDLRQIPQMRDVVDLRSVGHSRHRTPLLEKTGPRSFPDRRYQIPTLPPSSSTTAVSAFPRRLGAGAAYPALLGWAAPLARATGLASGSVTTSVRSQVSFAFSWRSNLARALHRLRCSMRRFYPLPDATSTGPSHWQSKWQSIHRLPSVPPRRIHARLKSNEADRVDQASAMLEEMQRLPSISQFSQRIAQEKAKLVSNDAAVQRKVDGVLKDFEDDLKNSSTPAASNRSTRGSARPATTRRPTPGPTRRSRRSSEAQARPCIHWLFFLRGLLASPVSPECSGRRMMPCGCCPGRKRP